MWRLKTTCKTLSMCQRAACPDDLLNSLIFRDLCLATKLFLSTVFLSRRYTSRWNEDVTTEMTRMMEASAHCCTLISIHLRELRLTDSSARVFLQDIAGDRDRDSLFLLPQLAWFQKPCAAGAAKTNCRRSPRAELRAVSRLPCKCHAEKPTAWEIPRSLSCV